jgi:hypothetical protein
VFRHAAAVAVIRRSRQLPARFLSQSRHISYQSNPRRRRDESSRVLPDHLSKNGPRSFNSAMIDGRLPALIIDWWPRS